MSYSDYKAGNNCAKIQGWNDTGYVCPYVPRRHITQIDSIDLNITGNRKVNRKLTLDLEITGEVDLLEKENTIITIVKEGSTGTEDNYVLYDETATDWNHREFIFKEPGTYTVSAVATDGTDTFPVETTIVIADDLAPVADYTLDSDSHIYTRNEEGIASVHITDCSASELGDAIISRTYHIYYDANLDGVYSEDEIIQNVTGNETELALSLDGVGTYKIDLSIQEHFDDTILSLVDDSVYLKGDTTMKSEEDVTFEIVNQAPSSSMSIEKSKLADIIFTVSDADSETLAAYSEATKQVEEQLKEQGIQANVSTVSTSALTAQDTFAWEEYDHYNYDDIFLPTLEKHIIYDGNDIIMMGYSCAEMIDFLYVPDNNPNRKVFEFDLQKDNTNWHSMEGGGFLFNTAVSSEEDYIQGYCILVTYSGLKLIQIDRVSLSDFRNEQYIYVQETGRLLQTFPIENLYANHHFRIIIDGNIITLYDGDTLIIDEYVLPDDGVEAYGYGPITSYLHHYCHQQSYFTFKNIVMQTVTGESLSDVVNHHEWTPRTNHYVINLSQTSVPELSEIDRMADVSATLIQNDVMFFGVGNDTTIDQYNALVNSIDGKGSNIVLSDEEDAAEDGTESETDKIVMVQNAVDNIVSQIVADVRSKDYSIGYTLASDEPVAYTGTYYDPDGDEAGEQEWVYVYDSSVFGESDAEANAESDAEEATDSLQTIRTTEPITIFENTGAYEISLRVSDNPTKGNAALSSYIKWSEKDEYQKLILSQNRPAASVTATTMQSPTDSSKCMVNVVYESEDADHPSDDRKGIRDEKFYYKKLTDSEWTEGRFLTEVEMGTTYLVKYVVTDIEGTVSRPAVCAIKTNEARTYVEPEDTTSPDVSLSVNASTVEIGETFYIEASASDDYGVTDFQVTVNGENVGVIYGRISYIPTEAGEYTITATATDICGNVGTETKTIQVIDSSDTTPPAITITSPKNGTIVGTTDIIGSITDNKGIKAYTVALYNCNEIEDNGAESNTVGEGTEDTTPVILASGTKEVINDTIAQLDTDGLDAGLYKIVITATDKAGLQSETTIFLTVETTNGNDTVPPQAMISEIKLSDDNSVIQIIGTIEDETQLASYELLLYRLDENGTVLETTSIASGTEAISGDVIGTIQTEGFAGGSYRIELSVNDAAGNGTMTGASFTYTAPESGEGDNSGEISPNEDTNPPVILAELITNITENGLQIQLTGCINDDNLSNYQVYTGRKTSTQDDYTWMAVAAGTDSGNEGILADYTYSDVLAGDYIVKIIAEDTAGNQKIAEYAFAVTDEGSLEGTYNGEETELSFVLSANNVDISETVLAYISYPKGAEDICLSVNGNVVEISERIANITVEEAGLYEVVLSATVDGVVQTISEELRFFDKSDTEQPEAIILTPSAESILKTETEIMATISDNNGIAYYTLDYRMEGSDTYTELASGTEPVENIVSGTLDTTLLQNGRYTVRLTVVDNGGNRTRTERAFYVEGNLKVGNLSLGFTDMQTEVSGLPLALNRYYDSRNKAAGDFGYGWSLGLQSVKLIESSDIRQGYSLVQTGNRLATAYYLVQTESHIITVTYGDGTSDRFELILTPDRQGLVPISEVNVSFVCLTNPKVTLALDGDNTALVYGGQLIFADDTLFEKSAYVLKREDGTILYLDADYGLTRMEDANGNAVQISSSGYVHSSGTRILFERDEKGRIVSATETKKGFDEPINRMEYAYDSQNNLISVTDLAGKTVSFMYDDEHNMTGMTDSTGRTVARNEYDEEGRLVATIDAEGNRITYTHDIEGRNEIVRDRLGNATVYTYDDNGNILRIVDALGNVTEHTYDDNNNLLTTTDALGNVTTYAYDENNNLITTIDALGQVTTTTYGSNHEILTITQDNLLSVSIGYDKKGNIISSTDTAGNVTNYTYENNGSLSSISDSIGTVLTLTYDADGQVATATDGIGNTISYTYDSRGNCIATEFTKQTDSSSESIRNLYLYDASGNVIKTIDSQGGEQTLEYDENGAIKAMTDEAGIRTTYEYDSLGNMTAIRYADGTAETFTYDANGNLLTSTSREGLSRTYQYDALGRNTAILLPDGNQVTYEYDALGNLTGCTGETGIHTTYIYDALGRNTAVIDDDGNEVKYTYGPSSELLAVTDKLGRTTSYTYDNAGNVIRITYPDNQSMTMEYDARARLTKETDALGNTTEYGYDNADRLTIITDALGNATRYEYDNLGELCSITDAKGNQTTYTYDTLGRRTSDTNAAGQTRTYAYDATGNLVKDTSYSGIVTEYLYDEYGRLVRVEVSDSGENGTVLGVTTYTKRYLWKNYCSCRRKRNDILYI